MSAFVAEGMPVERGGSLCVLLRILFWGEWPALASKSASLIHALLVLSPYSKLMSLRCGACFRTLEISVTACFK